ncbi:MAG: FecR domain-containing protein [Sulfuritalea sp.]|nr:FecR domain-containing protein [Sulfuritalea sp.]
MKPGETARIIALSFLERSCGCGVRRRLRGPSTRFRGMSLSPVPTGRARKAGPKERIQSGDLITTQAKSEVVIKLADESVIALRPNTQFRVAEFKYEKQPTDTAQFSLLRGAARFLTGLVGRASPHRVRVTAVTADSRHSRHGL